MRISKAIVVSRREPNKRRVCCQNDLAVRGEATCTRFIESNHERRPPPHRRSSSRKSCRAVAFSGSSYEYIQVFGADRVDNCPVGEALLERAESDASRRSFLRADSLAHANTVVRSS